MLEVVADSAADARADVRSNVFLAATLVAAGMTRATRIRNISATGVLLEGSDLPAEGSTVQLRRGSLVAAGEVAWRASSQCGVRFREHVVAADWVRRVEHSGQQRVDRIVTLLRRPPFAEAVSLMLMPGEDTLDAISTNLTEACERLSDIPLLMETYSERLLELDAVAQRLKHLLQAKSPPQ